jgi:DNA invertase Pin-like site-specific DNA recombinase
MHKRVDRRWGGATRISDDPYDEQRGITRQTIDIKEAVASAGGDPASITWYAENDTSAFKKRRVALTDSLGNEYTGLRVIRPVWHKALHDLRTGVINALMVWDLDRLARDPRDLEDAIEVVELHGAHIVSATASQIDLTTDAGIAWARMLVVMANKASADTRRRVTREHRDAAEKGLPRGGVRPFGYEKDKVTILESEAVVVRRLAGAVIAGRSLHELARELNEEGVKTTLGNDFVPNTVRAIVMNARYAGWRTDKARKIVTANGEPVRGTWKPILDQDTFDRVQLVLTDQARVKGPRSRKGARKYLLSGILRCGICNGVLYGNIDQRRGIHYYTCKALRGRKHSLAVSGASAERVVGAQVGLRLLALPETQREPEPFGGDGRLAELDQLIADGMAQIDKDPNLSGVVYPRVSAWAQEQTALTEERTKWLLETSGPTVKAVDAADWAAMDLPTKRSHIENLVDAVIVRPPDPEKRGPRFDPNRLVYAWSGGDAQPESGSG